MGLRDVARKGLSLFCDFDEAPSAAAASGPGDSDSDYVRKLRSRTVGDLLEELDGPGPEQIESAVQAAAAAPPMSEGRLDFAALYAQAHIEAMTFGAERTLELIQSYPSDMPVAVRRQALDAALKPICEAMKVSREALVADASRKLNALAGFAEAAKTERDSTVSQIQTTIQGLQAQIQSEQERSAAAESRYQAIVEQCEAEGERLDQVQEFLTLDHPPSSMAPGPQGGPRPPGTA